MDRDSDGRSDNVAVFVVFAVIGGVARDIQLASRPSCHVMTAVVRCHMAGDDRVVAPDGRAVDVRQVDILDSWLDGGDTWTGERAATEQVPVEVLTEHAADKVQGDRVHARVDEAQAEADDAERVPIIIVHVVWVRIEVEPHHEHVVRQEADHEYDDKRQHHLGHLLPGTDLARLASVPQLTRHVARGYHQVMRHQQVEATDHTQRHCVVRQYLEQDHALFVALT